MLIVGAALPGHAKGDFEAGFNARESELLFGSIAAVIALGFAVMIFRGLRCQLSPQFIFHGAYLLGLSLLGYCLWATLTLLPIRENPAIVDEWSTRILEAAFCGPIICQFVIAVALLLLVCATFYDHSRKP